jgi:AAA domain, putative AbiEii toxin, Type IV TA system
MHPANAFTKAGKMKIHLSQVVIINRAPFPTLRISLNESEIAVLTAVNGRGKTTILSHIVDAFYEMTKQHFSDVAESVTAYYRVSSALDHLDGTRFSLVYLRFTAEDQIIDYVDLRGPCTKEEYETEVGLKNPINFDNQLAEPLKLAGNIKAVTPNLSKELANKIFPENVMTYFPAYRFEVPSYLNKSFQERLVFAKDSRFSGRLDKPLEVFTSLPSIANWLMDVVLDIREVPGTNHNLFNSLNTIISNALSSKNCGAVRFGVGPRQLGSTRIQIVQDGPIPQTIYPSVFRLSSGESALLCIFAEILRHADLTANTTNLAEVSGIVLIDEVDKHLHIKLQKEVLPKLFGLFPKIQFIVSSHSPFLNMGLAQLLPERSRVIDIQTGLAIPASTDPQYQEVYDLMVNENTRFKTMYESVVAQIDAGKQLQILSEGKNYEHIEKALSLLAPDYLLKIKLVKGSEDRSGDQQLKNTFDIMSRASHSGKFLVVWDCDSSAIAARLSETDLFHKFCFDKNLSNNTTDKGIENLYSEELFTPDLYDKKTTPTGYGGHKEETTFSKFRFGEKVKGLTAVEAFSNFQPLVDKIGNLLFSLPHVEEGKNAK